MLDVQTVTKDGSVRSGSLREALEVRRVRGETFSLKEAIAVVVPLCTQLAASHAKGGKWFVHPSALSHGRAGSELDVAAASVLPTHERDRPCVAPESRRGDPGDSCSSVFSVGAILYELVTGEVVGPGMKRPSEIQPSLPPQLEIVLGKALVSDPKHRPHDLGALAQALHHLSPTASLPPPDADESHLDHEDDFDVDVSLSMIPPPPVPRRGEVAPAPAGGPMGFVPAAPAIPDDPTAKLTSLKEKLEDDPRPRFIVIKDGMDHGPFSAVEMLQQLASHQFHGEHILRDSISGDARPISEWSEFALFAHQANLTREIKQERVALEHVVSAERHRTQWKALLGATALGLLLAAGAAYWLRERARENDEVSLRQEQVTAVDASGALSAGKDGKKEPGGAAAGGNGKYPQIAGGGSCEAARAKYVEDYSQQGVPPDLSSGAYAGTLSKGSYLNSCGVPANVAVSVCAAIQNGRAVGVTVSTNPSNPGVSSCVRSQVMGMSFPSHPRMDIVTTTFAAQ